MDVAVLVVVLLGLLDEEFELVVLVEEGVLASEFFEYEGFELALQGSCLLEVVEVGLLDGEVVVGLGEVEEEGGAGLVLGEVDLLHVLDGLECVLDGVLVPGQAAEECRDVELGDAELVEVFLVAEQLLDLEDGFLKLYGFVEVWVPAEEANVDVEQVEPAAGPEQLPGEVLGGGEEEGVELGEGLAHGAGVLGGLGGVEVEGVVGEGLEGAGQEGREVGVGQAGEVTVE